MARLSTKATSAAGPKQTAEQLELCSEGRRSPAGIMLIRPPAKLCVFTSERDSLALLTDVETADRQVARVLVGEDELQEDATGGRSYEVPKRAQSTQQAGKRCKVDQGKAKQSQRREER
ncbi:hypothetical protein NDU88_006267 [Pleurodeles waltl]|uniref:Uncharacterized protein n=1 Tax=Pleurodeles waltl TaxID=8319 RepID=A0AAV7PJ92_PLEWA|nr:hypothetical protein NDU88_006267 [Pleurodeles waltl]